MSKKSFKLYGFHKNCNTQYSLIYMLERWKSTLDKVKHMRAVFMDFSKAFDTLKIDLLMAKLEAYGFSHYSCLFHVCLFI